MEKVAITGMGVVSSAGSNLKAFWQTLFSGTKTYGEIQEFKDNPNYRIKIGARVKDPSWKCNVNEEYKVKYGHASNYAISASMSALENSGLNLEDISRVCTAVCIGTTMGEIQVEEQISAIRHNMGLDNVQKYLFNQYPINNIGYSVMDATKASGPVYTVPTACAAGNYAIALGARFIEHGYADIVIAGGVDVFSRVAFTGFQRLLSLTPDLCKPFDRKRKGLVVGEGCGILILENIKHARARGAKIHGHILGVGLTSDSYHMTSPHPDGDGAVRAMNLALQEAGLSTADIDYISAHGTGTVANDKVEVKALGKIFGMDTIPPTSSIKSMLGHAMGAASALELIASVQMIEYGAMLPTINYGEEDSECNIDCVPNLPRKAKLNTILSNSYAFGGQVSSVIVGKR